MNSSGTFIDDGCLRPIWRFFLSCVVVFMAYLSSAMVVGLAYHGRRIHPEPVRALFWLTLMTLPMILAGFKLLTAVFERQPLGSVGLAFHCGWRKELGHGLAVGGVMILMVATLERACGLVQATYAPQPVLRAALFTVVLFSVGAVNEEASFRGYPFQRLVESITPVGAILVTSTLFGLGHLWNPHHTWISTINTALVGVPFAIAYLRTRSLWMPIGMHFIWNFLMGFLLGLPVSGITFPVTILTARVQGPIWLTGGDYGPEGGLLATGAIVIGTMYVSLAKSIYTSEEMKALVLAPVLSRRPEPPITIFPAAPEEPVKKD
jgi:membrane protease YdiL (CAAX protease family)